MGRQKLEYHWKIIDTIFIQIYPTSEYSSHTTDDELKYQELRYW